MVEDARRWIWAWVSGWLTPTGLFVLLNLVIGTIAVTNRAHRHRDRPAAAAAEGARAPSRAPPPPSCSSASAPSALPLPLRRLPPRLHPLLRRRTRGGARPDQIAENLSEAEEEERHHFGRSRSESRVPAAAVEVEGEGAGRMKKSASASSAFAKFEEARCARRRAAVEEEEEVNARADDFINRFRQQLQLQRLNSLLNYKEMLNRGHR
uniref:DUF4408 domain-containing protein n=1 Tax=Ananas comosus var. bracteatus TaxID=296719 RepID=A0A6V7QUV7_ANACO